MTPTSRAALAAALLALAACGGAEGVTGTEFPIDPPPTGPTAPTAPTAPNTGPTAVRITPRTTTLVPGASARLSAGATDAAGNLLPDASVTWVSLDATTVSAGAGGTIAALKVGNARIVAISGTGRDTAIVSVTTTPPPPVASVSVTPDVLTLAPGAGQQLAALARDGAGTPLTDRPIGWSSSAASIATVTANGYVRGVASGSALVVVAAEGRADTVHVTVRVPGSAPAPATVTSVSISPAAVELAIQGTQQLLVSAFDAEGQVMTGRPVTWTSAATGIATVSSSGRVTAVAAGTTTVRATVDGVTAEVAVRVTPPLATPATMTTSVSSVSIGAGATYDVTATLRDDDGAAVTGYDIAWSSANAAVATVSSTGRITAVANGTTKLTVTGSGLTAEVAVTVAGDASTVSVGITPSSFGSVGRVGASTVLLPSVLVAGDDDPAGLTTLQAIAIFSLADVPAGATVSSATLGITIDTAAVFGAPYGLGTLHAERTTAVDANAAAPAADAVLLASAPTPAIAAELKTLVQAALAAGDDYVAVRIRFASPSNANGQTDQLELAIGSLAVSWAR